MKVVYVSNENYVRHLAVSLCSLCDNNADEEELELWVISTGITPESEEKLRKTAAAFDREIRFLELEDLKERFGGVLDTGSFDISTMGRLFLGTLLPERVEKVLYLDCDTVVLKPLEKLWNAPMRGCLMAAVQEPTIYREVKEYLNLSADAPYYNAGMLLLDLRQWREEQAETKVLRYYKSIAAQSLFNDQDALNGAFAGRFLTVGPRWNFFTNYRYFRYDTLVKMSPAYGKIPAKQFRSAKARPAVIHFAGDERPWKAGALNYYGKAYDLYLAMTPWAGTPKEKGSRLKLLAYHGMDLVTPVLPAVRAGISGWYVKKLLAARAARMENVSGGRRAPEAAEK